MAVYKGAAIPLVLLVIVSVLSCASVIDTSIKFEKNKTYAVVPFENYTDTPLAGYRVAASFEGVLRAKGFKVKERVWEYKDTEPTGKELKEIIKASMKKADYVVMGTVNEFRYRTGIDGEPVVSVSVFVLDARRGTIKSGATLSANGWIRDSLGTLLHKLVRNAIE